MVKSETTKGWWRLLDDDEEIAPGDEWCFPSDGVPLVWTKENKIFPDGHTVAHERVRLGPDVVYRRKV